MLAKILSAAAISCWSCIGCPSSPKTTSPSWAWFARSSWSVLKEASKAFTTSGLSESTFALNLLQAEDKDPVELPLPTKPNKQLVSKLPIDKLVWLIVVVGSSLEDLLSSEDLSSPATCEPSSGTAGNSLAETFPTFTQ